MLISLSSDAEDLHVAISVLFCFSYELPCKHLKRLEGQSGAQFIRGNKAAHMTPESIQTLGHQVLSIQYVTKAEIKVTTT